MKFVNINTENSCIFMTHEYYKDFMTPLINVLLFRSLDSNLLFEGFFFPSDSLKRLLCFHPYKLLLSTF